MTDYARGPGRGYQPHTGDPIELVAPEVQAETNRVGIAKVRAALAATQPDAAAEAEELPPDALADALSVHVRATYRGDVKGGWICAGCGLPVPTEHRHARHLAEIARGHS